MPYSGDAWRKGLPERTGDATKKHWKLADAFPLDPADSNEHTQSRMALDGLLR